MAAVPHTATPDRLDADDATLEAALADAHIPTLMTALVHVTGDIGILRRGIRPQSAFLGDAQGGISAEDQATIRAEAFNVLRRWRDAGCPPLHVPDAAMVREMIDFMVGQPLPADYVEFLQSELALDGRDPYAQPALDAVDPAVRAQFNVVIIGAGMSGLLAAIRLKQAGIPFTVLEKNADVGGTWYENSYPGCRVDSPNHIYSYSFAPRDWPQHYSNRDVLRQYFADIADEYGLREHIRFNCEVQASRWDEARGRWMVEATGADGAALRLEAHAIISCVGQLNRPNMPDIEGVGTFTGPAFHSARWEHQHDLTGKRVGVIGTGASAFQFVPIIAQQAASVTIFQRTAPWVVPNENYFSAVPGGKHFLLGHIPYYQKWYRFNMFWNAAEGLLDNVRKDEAWNEPGSISAGNAELRAMLTEHVRANVGGDERLMSMLIPDYPPGGKRMLIDDGTWLRSLTRSNVHLTDERIAAITPQGVRTVGGAEHEFDVLIYATGFQASRFLSPMKFHGVGGVELHEAWDGEPRAYLGITMPGFPNLFACYGPNTNIVVNGSIIFFSECEVRYILGCIAMLLDRGARALQPKRDVHDRFNAVIDAGNLQMSWGYEGVKSWYKNANGRVTQNWPFTLREYWSRTRTPDPADFEIA